MNDREAFEAWWISCFPIADLERGVDDRYIVRDTELAWNGWQAKSARESKIVRDLIAQSDRDPFMTVGHFVEHCCDKAPLASERAKQAEPVASMKRALEKFRDVDNTECGRDWFISRVAWHLDHAAPPADDEAVRLLKFCQDEMINSDLRDEIDAYLARVTT